MISWREIGRWLWKHLPETGYTGDILCTVPKPGSFFDKQAVLPPYFREFWNLFASRAKLEKYDVVFAWELRTAVAVALLRKIRGRNRQSRFVAVGPILKGFALRVLPIVSWLLSEADMIVCFSRAECETQAQQLGLPQSRFVFVPTAWQDEEIAPEVKRGYILALGHSGRDYPTLLEAVQETDLPMIMAIKERSDLGGVAVPPNVRVRYQTDQKETDALVTGASLVVVPLFERAHSAGQSVLLRSMAQGKAIIVTDTEGIRDYVQDGETALLVPPGDSTVLRAAIVRLWADAAERKRMGENAARIQRQDFSFERFTARMVELADNLTS